jgi:hypothetical protein
MKNGHPKEQYSFLSSLIRSSVKSESKFTQSELVFFFCPSLCSLFSSFQSQVKFAITAIFSSLFFSPLFFSSLLFSSLLFSSLLFSSPLLSSLLFSSLWVSSLFFEFLLLSSLLFSFTLFSSSLPSFSHSFSVS